ncbi:hypothetical protein PMKS-003329 [Pichia membranifaciens]|uniref:Ubiquitin-like modifier-activating enzyme ATG7 n=1 Tax=Pichia membranifaciens TaxID=4926 RepID=A0A1Q2YJV3_9ASCO|nr:hypothetical protein PMKS-003329 [Pichia membranifaciens]
MTDPLMYAPAVSYADSSFFVELSALKLDVLKLDTSYRDIVAYYNYSALGTEQPPSLNVSDLSLQGESYLVKQLPPQSFFLSRGKLFNVNSIEEFKNVNKKDLLTESALWIWNKIKDKSFIENTSVLSSFILLSYADLKKYKFYYWFAFPQLQSEWVQIKASPGVKFTVEDRLFEQQFYIISSESDDSLLPLTDLFDQDRSFLKILFIDTCSYENTTAYILRNFLTALAYYNFHKVEIQVVKYSQPTLSFTTCLENANYSSTALTDPSYLPPVSGWEKTLRGKLGPKLANLGSLIDPIQLADQAIDLNLKLMKWRLVPQLNLQLVKDSKILILGSGTLGSYTARCLLAWGIRKITFVDNGKVSFSNPVRQPLFNYEDCLDGGSPKAETAAENLKKIFPLVDATGHTLEVPMIGHPVKDEVKERADFERLEKLVDEHDAIFLLLDSREARWLPTVLGNSKNKIVINAALGFESYLVMRHGCVKPDKSLSEQQSGRLGCYFCNDIVAPTDSTSDRTLDQMCTVTRPGVALMASSLAAELLVSILQTPEKQYSKHVAVDRSNILGSLPHQLRGFLHNFELLKVSSNNFKCCTACSIPVIEAFNDDGWEFVKRSLNESTYLEDLTGLKKFHQEAEKAALMMEGLEDLEDLDLEDEEIV